MIKEYLFTKKPSHKRIFLIIALVVVVAFAAFIIATACVWFKHHNIDHEKYADAETNIENTNINN